MRRERAPWRSLYVDNIKYGHLASIAPSVVLGAHLLQGDAIGIEGNTGNTVPLTCGVHLHWEFGGVTYGSPLAPIDGGSSSSTNSVIGESGTMGATLRSYYIANGGWGSIGWTVNHCPGACTFNMTNNKSWGRMQDFEHDPDGFGGTFDTINVSNYTPTQAYLVDSVFWPYWAQGGVPPGATNPRPIAMATSERGACPSGSLSNCLLYQHFQLGFVWMDSFTGRHAVFCPDLNGDQRITILDLNIEGARYNMTAVAPAMDIDTGDDGMVTILDISSMAGLYGVDCHV